MNLSSRPRKAASRRFGLVHRRLHRFAMATILAVGLLALPWPAQAKVVYVPANVTVSGNGTITLPVNGGTVAFDIQAVAKSTTCENFQVSEASVTVAPNTVDAGTGVAAVGEDASALSAGTLIDSSQNFYQAQALMASELIENEPPPCDTSHYDGYWCDDDLGHLCTSVDRYLGLEFEFKGGTHYGWAHMIIIPDAHSVMFVVQLEGFAYETVPGQGIKAGQKSDDPLVSPDPPNSANISASPTASSASPSESKTSKTSSPTSTRPSPILRLIRTPA